MVRRVRKLPSFEFDSFTSPPDRTIRDTISTENLVYAPIFTRNLSFVVKGHKSCKNMFSSPAVEIFSDFTQVMKKESLLFTCHPTRQNVRSLRPPEPASDPAWYECVIRWNPHSRTDFLSQSSGPEQQYQPNPTHQTAGFPCLCFKVDVGAARRTGSWHVDRKLTCNRHGARR